MATGPFNYAIEIPDPMAAFTGALRAGADIQAIQARQAQTAAEAERQKQVAAAMARARESGRYEDYIQLSMLMPVEQGKLVLEGAKALDATQATAALDRASRVFSALRANQPEIAADEIRRQAQALRNNKDEEGARFLETWANVTQVDPDSTELFFGTKMSGLPGGKERMEAIYQYGKEKREEKEFPRLMAKRAAELRTAQSEAEVKAIEAKYAEEMAKAKLASEQAKGQEKYEMISPDQARTLGLPAGPAYQRDKLTGKITALGPTGTTIKMPSMIGNIPPDYRVEYDSEGRPVSMVPIPGSKTARELGAQATRESERAAGASQTAGIVIEELNRLESRIKNQQVYDPVTGVLGKAAEKIPGSARASAIGLINTIRANIGFDRLAQMRAESPTGGALGNITEQELKFLQSVLGELSLDQKDEDIVKNIGRLRTLYEQIKKKADAYPNAAKYGFGSGGSAPPGAPGAAPGPRGGTATPPGGGATGGWEIVRIIPGSQ